MIKLDSVLFWILAGLTLLLPVIFVPVSVVPFIYFKYALLVLVIVAVVAIWVLLRLKDGVCLFPINILNLSGILVLLTLLLSSLFSGSIRNSLFGQLSQTDTFIFYLYAFLIMFIVPTVFNSVRRIFSLYKIYFISFALLALFLIIRLLFGPTWLNFGYFLNITDNPLGKWNDLGIFFGLGAVLSLFSLELLTLKKTYRIFFIATLTVSMALLAVVGFILSWYVLGALALVFFVYSIVIARSANIKKTETTLPIVSFVVFIISVVFIIGGVRLGWVISSSLNISQIDAVPTWQATAGVAKGVIFTSPLRAMFGAGPNRFANEWALFKPAGINNSIFWNTDFNYGSGIVPSTLITTGVIGFLSWLLFLGIFVYMGFRSILSRVKDPFQKYLITSSFFAALYLWLFNVIYAPGLVIIVLTFFFTGLFISALHTAGILRFVRFEYFKSPKVGFVSVLALVIVLICGLGLVYMTTSKFVAAAYHNQGLIAVNKNDLDLGEKKIRDAIGLDKNDLYARSLAQLYLVRLSVLLSSSADSNSPDEIKNRFSQISNTALSAAQLAVSIDDKNYQNWLTMGDVWSALVPVKIDKSYENALFAYQKAVIYNPQSPYTYIQLAKLDSAQGDVAKAKDDLIKAFNLKRDYTDAYLFLAQLQVSEGDIKSAIDSVTVASASSPNDPGLLFQLGVLRYNDKDYKNAISAFERAVAINEQYSNAKYLLGLSYYQADRVSDAIGQFIDLQKLNPDNQEIKGILDNLQNGKPLFPKTEVVNPKNGK